MGESTRRETGVSRRAFIRRGATAGVGATALAGVGARPAEAQNFWDVSADFVTIGAGTAGLAAAVSALDHGASVILLEENVDIGGHGLCSGGNVHLGGGTSNQRKHGVEDSAERVYQRLGAPRPHAEPLQRPRPRPGLRRRERADLRVPHRERRAVPGPPRRADRGVAGAPAAAHRAVARRQRAGDAPRDPGRLGPRPRPREERAGQGGAGAAAAQDDEHRPREPVGGPGARGHRRPRRAAPSTSGPSRGCSSPPAAAPATSTCGAPSIPG